MKVKCIIVTIMLFALFMPAFAIPAADTNENITGYETYMESTRYKLFFMFICKDCTARV